jgi:hypothetical protein
MMHICRKPRPQQRVGILLLKTMTMQEARVPQHLSISLELHVHFLLLRVPGPFGKLPSVVSFAFPLSWPFHFRLAAALLQVHKRQRCESPLPEGGRILQTFQQKVDFDFPREGDFRSSLRLPGNKIKVVLENFRIDGSTGPGVDTWSSTAMLSRRLTHFLFKDIWEGCAMVCVWGGAVIEHLRRVGRSESVGSKRR